MKLKKVWYWKFKIKRFFKWFYLRIPVMMGTHVNLKMEYNKKIKDLINVHEIELGEREKRVDEILKTLSKATVFTEKNHPYYGVSFKFSDIMVNNLIDIGKNKIIARRAGRILEQEILKSKFIQLPEINNGNN